MIPQKQHFASCLFIFFVLSAEHHVVRLCFLRNFFFFFSVAQLVSAPRLLEWRTVTVEIVHTECNVLGNANDLRGVH